jgi:hypothetical protein
MTASVRRRFRLGLPVEFPPLIGSALSSLQHARCQVSDTGMAVASKGDPKVDRSVDGWGGWSIGRAIGGSAGRAIGGSGGRSIGCSCSVLCLVGRYCGWPSATDASSPGKARSCMCTTLELTSVRQVLTSIAGGPVQVWRCKRCERANTVAAIQLVYAYGLGLRSVALLPNLPCTSSLSR